MEDRRLAGVRHRLGHSLAGDPNAVGGPVGNAACPQGGSDCGERIRPRQRRPPGRPCHPAIYGSAQSAKPLPTSGADGLGAPRFVTGEVSQPPQRSQYILSHTTITVNHAFLPPQCPVIGLSFTRETAMGRCRYCGQRVGWLRSSHRRCAATYRQGLAQLVDLVVAPPASPTSPSGECCAFWMDWLSSATCQPNT